MIPYLLYYIIGISIIFFDKKWIPISFSLLWFVFVGFRDAIGTDYFSTLEVFQRSYIDFENPALSFTSYNLVDLELVFKLIATFFYYTHLRIEGAYILIAFLESVFIYQILKKAKHKQLFVFYFLTMFTLFYPMNAIRQGLSLLILIYALSFLKSNEKFKKRFFIIFSSFTHYASVPIIFLSSIKFNKSKLQVILLVSLFIVFYVFQEMLFLRYPIDTQNYNFKGNGLRLYIFTIVPIAVNVFLMKRKIYCQENVILLALLVSTVKFNPLFRLFFFYVNIISFDNLYKMDNSTIGRNSILLLLIVPALTFSFDWLEVSRFVPMSGLGNWIPYKNFIFELLF